MKTLIHVKRGAINNTSYPLEYVTNVDRIKELLHALVIG